MKGSLFIVLVGWTATVNASRNKRTAYDLPDGFELIVGHVRTSFVCSSDGYYADQENNCQIFHVCRSVTNADGTYEMLQWSFLCGNQTVFNQFSFTCAYPEDSIPCERAADFFYLNDVIGVPNLPFHSQMDVTKAEAIRGRPGAVIPLYTPDVMPEKHQKDGGTEGDERRGSGYAGEVSSGTSGHTGRAPLLSNRPDQTVPEL